MLINLVNADNKDNAYNKDIAKNADNADKEESIQLYSADNTYRQLVLYRQFGQKLTIYGQFLQ